MLQMFAAAHDMEIVREQVRWCVCMGGGGAVCVFVTAPGDTPLRPP
jgi:hypothetical protein